MLKQTDATYLLHLTDLKKVIESQGKCCRANPMHTGTFAKRVTVKHDLKKKK